MVLDRQSQGLEPKSLMMFVLSMVVLVSQCWFNAYPREPPPLSLGDKHRIDSTSNIRYEPSIGCIFSDKKHLDFIVESKHAPCPTDYGIVYGILGSGHLSTNLCSGNSPKPVVPNQYSTMKTNGNFFARILPQQTNMCLTFIVQTKKTTTRYYKHN